MRFLFTVLLFMLMVVQTSHSRITLLPSDDTAGGGAGDIYWSQRYSSSASSFAVTTQCLRASGSGIFEQCFLSSDISPLSSTPFTGNVFIMGADCAPNVDIVDWEDANAFIDLAIYEVKGSAGSLPFERNQIGPSLRFTKVDRTYVSKPWVINDFTTVSNGMLQIGVSDRDPGTTTTLDSGFSCVMWGTR